MRESATRAAKNTLEILTIPVNIMLSYYDDGPHNKQIMLVETQVSWEENMFGNSNGKIEMRTTDVENIGLEIAR